MKFNKFCYRYSVIPAVMILFTNIFSFYMLRFVNAGRQYHSVLFDFENKIPFIPVFIYVYFLAFLQWLLSYLVIIAEDKKKAVYFCTAATVTNIICGITFIAYPTIMVGRPEITEPGFTNAFAAWIFSCDTPPVNLLPSIHCFESWMSIRLIFSSNKIPKAIKWGNLVFSVLVFASVLLVRQHVVVDIPAGILACELALFIVRKTRIDEKITLLERKIFKIKGEY